jgi:hypothetical protein
VKLSEVSFFDYLVMVVWVLVPLISFMVRRQYSEIFARWKWARRGIVYGTIALPVSVVLYSMFFLIPIIGIIPGLPGLLLVMWHLMPFGGAFPDFYGAVLGGASPTAGAFSVWKPTVFWSLAYGFLGAMLDVYLHRRRTQTLRGSGAAG